MITLRSAPIAVGALVLLSACSVQTPTYPLQIEPALRLQHAGTQSAETYYLLGKYYQDRGNFTAAKEAYLQALTLDSKHVDTRNALAVIVAQEGHPDQAVSKLQQLVQEYPDNVFLRNNLAYAQYLQHRYQAALTTLAHTLSLEPGNERARNNRALVLAALEASGNGASETIVDGAGPVEAAASSRPVAPGSDRDPQSPGLTTQAIAVQLEHNPLPASGTALSVSSVFQLDIVNGNGIEGMARRMRRTLQEQGLRVQRLGNKKPFTTRYTEIRYREGFAEQADRISSMLGGTAPRRSMSSSLGNADVLLILGKDLVGREPIRDAKLALREANKSDGQGTFTETR